MLDKLKIAIVCDWLTVYGGAERVVFEMHQLFPKAPIFTTLYDPKSCKVFAKADVRESWMGKVPFARRFHRLFFPFMPRIFEGMDLSEFDLVLTSSHAAAQGIITKPETLHVCYCHSPARYLWDHSHEYLNRYKAFKPFKWIYGPILHKVRRWDRLAAERVDRFIANSHFVAKRIQKFYRKEAFVIHPPVDLSVFELETRKEDHFLAVGRLVSSKHFDLVVDAFNENGKKLRIVGEGPEKANLMAKAQKNVEFLGRLSDEELKREYQTARALIFPQCEDFGIVPLEAMACGTPVLAFEAGGALETVQAGTSGLFFKEQTAESLNGVLKEFEKEHWDAEKIHVSVRDFASARFKSQLRHFLEEAFKQFQDENRG